MLRHYHPRPAAEFTLPTLLNRIDSPVHECYLQRPFKHKVPR